MNDYSRYFTKLTKEELSEIEENYTDFSEIAPIKQETKRDAEYIKTSVNRFASDVLVSFKEVNYKRSSFSISEDFIYVKIKDKLLEIVAMQDDYYLVLVRNASDGRIYNPFTFESVFRSLKGYRCDDLLGVVKLIEMLYNLK